MFSKALKYQISWKSVQWEPRSMRADKRTDRHNEPNRRSFQFFQCACKLTSLTFNEPASTVQWTHSVSVTQTSHLMQSSSSSSVICQTTGPKPLPKRFLHILRSRAPSFNWQYPLLSLRSASSFLRLLPRLLVTSISPFIFPSITCCRRQFLRKMWPIQLAFLCCIGK